MSFFNLIIYYFEQLRDLSLDIYEEVKGWVFPFYYLASPFYWFYNAFKWIAERFVDFKAWTLDVWEKVSAILGEWDIWSLLSQPIQWAMNAWDWVVDAFSNVWNIITDWWGTVSSTVLGWIEVAKQWLFDRIEDVKALANRTASDLSNFFTVTLPKLVGWGELDSIIISTLRTWFPMYDSFCYWWDKVEEFIADPLDWIYKRLEEFFERFW